MIGRLGTWALAAGLAGAVAATLLWLRVALGGPAARRAARIATGGTLAAAAVACVALERALLSHDFSVRFVAENGARSMPVYYTITSLWAALDGSLLLWLLLLCGYAALLARAVPARAEHLHPWAMTVVSAVAVFFFSLSYFAANPFQPIHPVPVDGPGPNPLLQEHPAMGVHPPLLYAGYIGLVIPFAYAVAALLAGRPGSEWLRAARRWSLTAWALLTAGIALGAWWSYAVLGWGGYWAWDPVENASLMPWLTATAFLHSVLVQRSRSVLGGWNIGLASASFILVLTGTFLTRSGAVDSVHAFTESPLGPMLLGFLLLTTTAVIALVGWRAHRLGAAEPIGPAISRETAFLGNAVLLTTLCAVVLIGTIYPLIAQALGTRAAVGPPYFNRSAVPLAVATLVLMGAAQLLRRDADRPAALARRLAVPGSAGLAAVAAVGLLSRPGPAALAAFGCATFVLAGTAARMAGEVRAARRAGGGAVRMLAARRAAYGGLIAHAGLALVASGVAGSSAYTSAAERQIGVGQVLTVQGVTARLITVDRRGGDAAMEVIARLALDRDGQPIGTAAPRLRYYPARDMTISVPAIRSDPARDVYATVIAVPPDGASATIRLAVNPLVGLIWAGAALTVLGGLLAAVRRSSARTGRTTTSPEQETPAHQDRVPAHTPSAPADAAAASDA